MLPPQLEHCLRQRSLSTTSTIALRALASSTARSTVAHLQTRSFWGWRRPLDYSSHIDPMFHRFTKFRTLRTRAKLLDKLRRRGRWDWDATQRPFFTPKHVRQAHHIGRPRWKDYENSRKQDTQDSAEEDGFELSRREKEWKDQMEAMRQRIEVDPYEAVFGKRFEPFWTPLVPRWMREEMGLDRSPRTKELKKSDKNAESIPYKPLAREPEPKAEPVKSRERPSSTQAKRDDVDGESPNGQLTSYSYTSKKGVSTDADPELPEGQLTNYSYGSTTSWDSWTKKTRREEWDSISGQTRRYEYDPITNRMVEVDRENPAVGKKIATSQSDAVRSDILKAQAQEQRAETATTQLGLSRATAPGARQAIPVPTQSVGTTSKKTSVYFPSLLNTSVISSLKKPSSLATVQEKDLDLLTAEDVRASMGNKKKTASEGVVSPYLPRRLETVNDRRTADIKDSTKPISSRNPLVPSVDRLSSKEASSVEEPDDAAAHESTGDPIYYRATNIPKAWDQQADLLQAERVQRTRGVLPEPRMVDIAEAKKSGERTSDGKLRWIDMMQARKARYDADQVAFKAAQEARNAEKNAKSDKMKAMLEAEVNAQKLHMHSHETRYVHKIQALRKELDTAYKQSSINAEMQVDRIRNLEQELARLQKAAGDNSQVAQYQTEAEKYQRKIQELRKELDLSFKQSSVATEKHVERIRDLEKELYKAQSDIQSKERYVQKTKSLREELDRTFKQSAANAEKHVERIRELEKALAGSRDKTSTAPDAMLAEGDFSANITKFAKDSNRWYKRPSSTSAATGTPSQNEVQKIAQKKRDRELVNEVRAIYESAYGKIDVHHRQQSEGQSKSDAAMLKRAPQVVEVESDVDLGKALADYEAGQTYEYRRDNLEAEIAAQEKEAIEAQTPSVLDQLAAKQDIVSALRMDQDVHGARIVDDTAPKLIPTEISSRTESTPKTDAESWGIQWEEPPVYKVLAYDAGNDFLSTATTSSNFSGRETPISIPQALSQLYQPARFVSHFAELQKQGYQVVHGTKDLLVFKKVKTVPEVTATKVEGQTSFADTDGKPTTIKPSQASPGPGVNPIDGTTFPFEPESASFASPTGFVGDRWETLASEGKVQSPSTISKAEPLQESAADLKSPRPSYSQPADEEAEFDIRHYPRVKREERVFSGSRLQRPKRHRRHHHEPTGEEIKHMKRKWSSWRARFRWVLSVALGSSAMAYGIGALTERSERKNQQDRERWQQILEGRRTRNE